MTTRRAYSVDAESLSTAERVRICRALVGVVAEAVDSFETDVPWSNRDEWPREVSQAAQVLTDQGRKQRRRNEAYAQTGRLSRSKSVPAVWDAWVTFAPYAFDATAWAADHGRLVSLADEGTSVAVWLSPDEFVRAGQEITPVPLRPLD
ncbi:hypothetical protein [Marmoricola sp. RAF53]|uniref:hypothetical protein n=1 Tax=Marmoricola sp. RAF53 TaxID=3233059 RepID=UPI003F982EA3